MRRYGLAIGLLLGLSLVVLLGAYWQPKDYKGNGLGLYVADGDSIRTGYIQADTAKVDTAAGVTLDFGRAWLDSINGEPYPPAALWQADISDSLAGFTPGGSGDMMAADVRDSILAAYTDTISVSVHDTADAVRNEIRDSLLAAAGSAGIWVDTTVHFGSIRSIQFNGPGDNIALVSTYSPATTFVAVDCAPESSLVFAAAGTYLLSLKYATDGTLTKVDSVVVPTHGVAWDAPNARLVTYSSAGKTARLYSVSTTSAMTLKDTTLIYTSNANGGLTREPISGAFYIGCINQLYYSRVKIQADTLKYDRMDKNSASAPMMYYLHADNGNLYIGNASTTEGLYTASVNAAGDLGSVGGTDVDGNDAIASNATHVFVSARSNKVFSVNRTTRAIVDSVTLTNNPNALQADRLGHLWIGEDNVGVIAASVDNDGIIALTDTVADAAAIPVLERTYDKPMAWTGNLLFLATASGLNTIAATDDGVITYKIESLFNDTTLIQGPVTIDLDADPEVYSPSHDLVVTEGAAYSYIDAGDGSWTASSSRQLKTMLAKFGTETAGALLDVVRGMPIYRWAYKGDSRQHAGPVAEDWWWAARILRDDAMPGEINSGDQTAALLLIVQELARRDSAHLADIADLRRRVQLLEADTQWMK